METARRPTTPVEAVASLRKAGSSHRLKRWAIWAVLLCGVLLGLGLLQQVGWRAVGASLASLGALGFLVFCGSTLGVLALLGYAWFVIAPGLALRLLPGFIFGRIMREAASDILPFSQIGGFVVGARAAVILGAPPSMAVASAAVDIATEMVGQLLFTGLGLWVLIEDAPRGFPHRLLDPILSAGLGVGLLTAGLFMAAQYFGLGLVNRLSARWAQALGAQAAAVQATFRTLYSRPGRVIASVGLHLLAWLCAAGAVWTTLRFMGSPLSYPRVVAMEGLIYLLRSAAFFVPGAIGVLEGGYVLLAPIFGLSAAAGLGVALAKRARDLTLGAPSALIWQALEARRLLGSSRRPLAR